MAETENTGRKQGGQFQKGRSGNPAGKPKGARNKTTLAMEELLDGEADAIVRTAIEKAKEGDGVALRLCLERIVPPRKERTIKFKMAVIATASDALQATGALIAAVAEGEITPGEAAELSKLIEGHIKSMEATDLAQRIEKLEQMIGHDPTQQ